MRLIEIELDNMGIKISLGADHGGYELKQSLHKWLNSKSLTVKDFGSHIQESVNYPVYAHLVAKSVQNNECDFGILVCGSGQGMAITANKYNKIRAALCWDKTIAALARQHNNANILVLPGRFISSEQAVEIAETFLSTIFEGGRHQKRVDMITQNLQSTTSLRANGASLRNSFLKRYKQWCYNSRKTGRSSGFRTNL